MKICLMYKKNGLGMHLLLVLAASMVAFSAAACKADSIDQNEEAYTKQKPASTAPQTNETQTDAAASPNSAQENTQEHIKEGRFEEITGADFFDGINYIHVIDVQEGVYIDASFEEFVEGSLMELVDSLYFHEPESGVVNGDEHLYQIKISNGEKEYFIDIYDNKEGCSAGLNNKWETREEAEVFSDILETLGSYPRQVNPDEAERLPDGEVISHFFDTIVASIDAEPLELKAGRYYICDEQFRVEHWDKDFSEVNGYKEVDFSAEQLSQLLSDIEAGYMLSSAPFASVAVYDTGINAEFIAEAKYDGYMLRFRANGAALYLTTEIDTRNYTIRIDNKYLRNMYVEMIIGDAMEFDFSDISDTEYISIHYIKDKDLKDYPENGRLSEIKITDSETVAQIVEVIAQNAAPTGTYPSRENADMIFHTANGDIYFKIKNPLTDDESQKEWILTEATIIAESYYWYDCPELYELLFEQLN